MGDRRFAALNAGMPKLGPKFMAPKKGGTSKVAKVSQAVKAASDANTLDPNQPPVDGPKKPPKEGGIVAGVDEGAKSARGELGSASSGGTQQGRAPSGSNPVEASKGASSPDSSTPSPGGPEFPGEPDTPDTPGGPHDPGSSQSAEGSTGESGESEKGDGGGKQAAGAGAGAGKSAVAKKAAEEVPGMKEVQSAREIAQNIRGGGEDKSIKQELKDTSKAVTEGAIKGASVAGPKGALVGGLKGLGEAALKSKRARRWGIALVGAGLAWQLLIASIIPALVMMVVGAVAAGQEDHSADRLTQTTGVSAQEVWQVRH